jgi:hypothetical protein
MHLAYSAINTITTSQHPQNNGLEDQTNNEMMIRYQAYQNTCNKYTHEIAAIQKYMPGWMPKFQ